MATASSTTAATPAATTPKPATKESAPTSAKRSRRASVPQVEDKKSGKTAVDAIAPASHLLHEVPLNQIDPHPDNPRTDLGDLTDLAASIGEQGVLEPVIVVPAPGSGTFPDRFRTIAGHRRCAAAREAGLSTVPAIIREGMTDAEQLEVMVVENSHRNDLTVIEQGHAFQGLLDYGMKRMAIAKRTGHAAKTVSARVKVAALPQSITDQVLEHELTFADAAQFADLKQSAPDLFEAALLEDVVNPAALVRSTLNKAAVAERLSKAQEEWKAKGHDLRLGYIQHDADALSDAVPVRHTLKMEPAEHANCPGAVVYCIEWGLRDVEVYGSFYCELPDLHAERIAELNTPAPVAPTPELTPAEKAVRELFQGLKDAAQERRMWLDELFTKPSVDNAPARSLMTAVAHDAVFAMLSGEASQYAVFPEVPPRRVDTALTVLTLSDPLDALSLYVLTEQIEPMTPQDSWDLEHFSQYGSPFVESYFTALQSAGYELSVAEQQVLIAAEEARIQRSAVNDAQPAEGAEGGEG